MIYAFLKADAELLARTPAGSPPPEPMLYDAAIHQAHQAGRYRPTKPRAERGRVIELAQRRG